MAIDTKAIQKFVSNDEQRLSLLSEYDPSEHIIQWTAFNKKTGKTDIIDYYPANWRLYELRLRYPTAKFDINILLMDQERNFCVVQAKLFVGPDYESADIRSIAHKQGPLTELDKVETKAKARAARDLGISTELALDMDDTPENEVRGTIVTEERQPSRNIVAAPTAEDIKRKRLNNLFKIGKEKGLFLDKEEMAKYVSKILKTTIEPDDIASLMDEEIVLLEGIIASQAQEQPKQEQTPEQALKARRLAVYERAKEMRQFDVSDKATENVQAFLKFVVPIVSATVANMEQLTVSRVDMIEQYLNAKDAG